MLCGVFFLVYNINEISGEVGLNEILIPLVVLLIIPILIKAVVALFAKSSIPSAIFTTILLSILLFYAHLFYFIISNQFLKTYLKEGYFIIILILIILLIGYFLVKTTRPLKTFNFYLNILFLTYLTFEVVHFVNHSNVDDMKGIMKQLDSVRKKDFKGKPDVYFIVADAYANAESLKKYWNYNNSMFINYLKEKGFFYVGYSKSNYNNTASSIASILNMEFLPKQLDVNSTMRRIEIQNQLIKKIKKSIVFQEFYRQGYDIYNLSIFNILNVKPYYFDRFLYPSFYNYILAKTLPMKIFYRYADMDRLSVLNELERISDIKNIRPKIIYCHLLLPHHPYVYDSTGVRTLSANPSFKQDMQYLEQLIYTNKLLKRSVDVIQMNDPNAIIILMSDHGYRQLAKEPDRTMESFDNFTSIYFPDRDYKELYNTMSAINIFNATINKVEGAQLKFKRDTSDFFY